MRTNRLRAQRASGANRPPGGVGCPTVFRRALDAMTTGTSVTIDSRLDAIETVCQTEADRPIAPLAEYAPGGWAAAGRSIAATPNASVAVLTGAYIPWATPPAAETDGPPGAALLAAGLIELGIP